MNQWRTRFLPALLGVVGCLVPMASGFAGTVYLLNGEILTGEVGIVNGRFQVRSGEGASGRAVPPGNVWHVDFRGAEDIRRPGPMEPFLKERFSEAGVLLVNGTFLGGLVKTFSQEEVTLAYTRTDEKQLDIESVARVNFFASPVTDLIIPPESEGVVMKNGNFVEGDFVKIENGDITIDSLVFGPSVFKQQHVQGVILQGHGMASTNYIITGRNGTRLLADKVELRQGSLAATDVMLGEMVLGELEVETFSVGNRRLRPLAAMTYIRRAPVVGNEDDLSIRTTPATAQPLVVDPVEQVVRMPAGNAMAVLAGDRYGGFLSRIGVPPEFPPEQQVIFQVRIDRTVAFRSDPMNSTSGIQMVSVRAPVRDYVILEVLPVNAATNEAPGLWIEPMLVRE